MIWFRSREMFYEHLLLEPEEIIFQVCYVKSEGIECLVGISCHGSMQKVMAAKMLTPQQKKNETSFPLTSIVRDICVL